MKTENPDNTGGAVNKDTTANTEFSQNSVNTRPAVNIDKDGATVDSVNSDNSANTANSTDKANSGNSRTEVNSADTSVADEGLFAGQLLPEETPKQQRQPKPQSGGKKQLKADFKEYSETFFTPYNLTKRHSLNIEDDTHRKLAKITRVLGDTETTVSSYADAILRAHIEAYAELHKAWAKTIDL